ncbi:MAG: hypothetical protein ACR2N2_10000 [Acidimicrobiia bacterium]
MKILVSLVALLALTAAATPQEAANVASQAGYFIEDGADATDEVIGGAVEQMRNAGSLFYAVVLSHEPTSGAATYAESVLNGVPDGEGLVLVAGPESVGWAKNNSIWTTPELNEALEVSLDGEDSDEVVLLFVGTLLDEDAAGGGGFPWFLVIIALIILGIAVLVWRSKRNREAAEKATFEQVRASAQAQIDAVANDILDDEDEVADAKNAEASEHFDRATEIYSAAADRLASAEDPEDVVEISTDLDRAIWHLDSAEAIIDGRPLPPKPEPPKPPEPAPTPTSVGMPPPTRTRSVEPLPPYERRSNRRSSYGADDMLKTVLAMQAMKGLSRSGTGSRSRSSISSRSSGRSKQSGRARGGGKRRK